MKKKEECERLQLEFLNDVNPATHRQYRAAADPRLLISPAPSHLSAPPSSHHVSGSAGAEWV